MKAIIFGSIGSVAETSELQRNAFNTAFEQYGLNWHWSQPEYQAMLRSSGGKKRIAEFAKSRGQSVDAAEVHRTKSAIFQESLETSSIKPRPGVIQLFENAKERGMKIGFATMTESLTVSAIMASLKADSGIGFDVSTSGENGFAAKPNSDVFDHVLNELACYPWDVIAIEDNFDGVKAAKAADIWTVGFAGANVSVDDLKDADLIALENINDAIPTHFLGASSSNIFPWKNV
jgi:beta-phosphoglucomutase-like phosphatase (HAD superfamily)